VGLLLNVDYGDQLARIRARDVLRRLQSARYVGEEEAIDAFYLHYRKPIFGGRPSNESWAYFVKAYVRSEYYREVGPICRLNPKASREAAVRLLRAYQAFLDSLEAGRDRFWRGRGIWLRWTEALRSLRRLMGDPADVHKLYASLRRLGEVLGPGRSADPASLAISIAADPARAKLADVVADVAELAARLDPADLEEGASPGPGVPDGIKLSSVSALRRATNVTKALYASSRELFAFKLATSTLSAKRYVSAGRLPLYILLDKSGSMYDLAPGLGVRRISVAAALAIALWRSSRNSLLRLFDVEVHRPEAEGGVVDLLLRVVPSGGTSIGRAVSSAVEEARRLGPRRYVLALVTDGEDDSLDGSVFERAREAFADVRVYLVGRRELKIGGVSVKHIASLPLKKPREHPEYDRGEAGGRHEIAYHPEPDDVHYYRLLPEARRAGRRV
jgi:uncharacterized protein with von Willebrand factor type A (vWA) domain